MRIRTNELKPMVISGLAALAFIMAFSGAASFSIVNAAWGTAGAPVSPSAGQYGVPFTVAVQNLMCQPIKDVSFTLSALNTGFSLAGGSGSAVQSTPIVQAGQQFSYTFYLNVPKNMTEGLYNMQGEIIYYYPQTVYTNCTAPQSSGYNLNTPAEYYAVPIFFSGNALLQFTQSSMQLVAGTVNNATFSVRNLGTGNATQVRVIVSVPSGKGSVISQPLVIPSIPAGQVAEMEFPIYLSGNVSGSPLQLNFSSTFLSGGSVLQTEKSQFALSVSSKPPVIILQNRTVAGVGSTTVLSIGIKNNGNVPLYYVQASLAQQQSFSANSSGTVSVTNGNPGYFEAIQPNQTVWFTPSVTTSPSVSEGGYNMRLSLIYTAGGASQTYNYNMGVIVAPRVAVELSDVTATPLGFNSTGIQVSGNLLDIGSGNAYYSQVYAYLLYNNTVIASNTSYVGEILSDSPTAFNLVLVPQGMERPPGEQQLGRQATSRNTTALSQANLRVKLYATYQDDMGNGLRSNSSSYVVSAGPQAGSGAIIPGSGNFALRNSRNSSNTYLYYIGASIAVAATVVYLYRRRGRGLKRKKERQVA